MKSTVSAWAPTHATLFFAVPEKKENLLEMGSIGGGVNFEMGMVTTVSQAERSSVHFNGKAIDGRVTLTAIEEFSKHTGMKGQFTVNHQSTIPIGHGLSTSGAGAIGTVLALNALLRTNLPMVELLQIAHIADAKNHTGLGSVLGQSVKGIELRTAQGAPGIGKVDSFYDPRNLVVVPIAPLSTADVLTSPRQMELVTKAGIEAVNLLRKEKTISLERIMEVGKKFMETCGLQTKRIAGLIESLEKNGEPHATMAMIGETLIILPKDLDRVLQWGNENGLICHTTKLSENLPYVIRQ